jgi:hypothetical protein
VVPAKRFLPIEALWQHLIDMNDVTLEADATDKTNRGGLETAVTGDGRTVDANSRAKPEP